MSGLLMVFLLAADWNDLFGFDGLVASAALGIQKLKQFLECVRICGVSEKGALSLHVDEVFRLELVEMMRQRGIGNFQLFLNLPGDEAFRVSGEQ
jgi:hypothetical protein